MSIRPHFTSLSVVLLVALFALLITQQGCKPKKIEGVAIKWRPYAELVGTFPKNSRPTMLFVSQNNCHYCHKMTDTIFTRPEIAWYVNEHFDAVEVNVDKDMPITIGGQSFDYHPFHELLSIQGIPCYYFFDAGGHIIGMLHGAQDVRDFKRILVYSVNGHFGKVPYTDWLKTDEANLDTLYGYW